MIKIGRMIDVEMVEEIPKEIRKEINFIQRRLH